MCYSEVSMPDLCWVLFFSGQRWCSTVVRCNAQGANNVSLTFLFGKTYLSSCRCCVRVAPSADGGGLDLQLGEVSTCTWSRAPLPLRSTTYSRRRSASGRSTMPPQAVQLHLVLVVDDPAIVNSICFLPLYAANSMSSSPLLCLEERRELVQLWLLLCWYVCFSEGTVLSLYSLSVYK